MLQRPWPAVGMGAGRLLLLLLLLLGSSQALRDEWKPGSYENTVSSATQFLYDYNSTAEQALFHSVSASWNYNTNITEHNSQLQVRAPLRLDPPLGTPAGWLRSFFLSLFASSHFFCGSQLEQSWPA